MLSAKDKAQFNYCISDLIKDKSVQAMREIPQHTNVNCLDHSVFVSYISFKLCRFFGLEYVAGSRGGLLHDLFLYDWRIEKNRRKLHLLSHPQTAMENASQLFDLNDMEKDIIKKHMWPLTIKMPKYMESFLVGCADKFCAIVEMLFIYRLFNIDEKLEMLCNPMCMVEQKPCLEAR
jgi:uncharacterized protein